MSKRTIALILAGGSGSRMKACCSFVPKQFASFNNKPVISYSYDTFIKNNNIFGVQLVLNPEKQDFFNKITQNRSKLLGIANSGNSRQQSVLSGLQAIENFNPDYVLIHDAARPLVSIGLINNVISCLEFGCDAAVPVLPVNDTVAIKGIDHNNFSFPDRKNIVTLQTPQGFRFSSIMKCHLKESGGSNYTDDISMMNINNYEIMQIAGERKNFKITSAFDLQILQSMPHYNLLD